MYVPRFRVSTQTGKHVPRFRIDAVQPNGSAHVLAVADLRSFRTTGAVWFFADQRLRRVVFSSRLRSSAAGAGCDVFDKAGTPLGWFTAQSTGWRAPWQFEAGGLRGLGQRRPAPPPRGFAKVFRFTDGIDERTYDIADALDGRIVLTCDGANGAGYEVGVHDQRLDFRLAAATVVGLAMSRRRSRSSSEYGCGDGDGCAGGSNCGGGSSCGGSSCGGGGGCGGGGSS